MLSPDAKLPRGLQSLLRSRVAFAAVIAIIGVAFLLWPGDAPFMGDEPMLFLMADAANQAHQLADDAMMGTTGVRYGPLPVWIYQITLLITTVPEGWIVLHVIILFSGVVAGLLMMARAFKLWRWFIPMVLLSPYMWFFCRHLWDNSFLLPFSALSFGFYVLYLKEKKSWALLVAVVCTIFLPLIHLMALPLFAAIVIHMVAMNWRALWQLRWSLMMVVAAVLTLHAGYFGILLSGTMHYAAHRTGQPIQWEAWWFPLFGGRLLSGWGIEYFGEHWFPENVAFRLIRGVTCFGYGAVLVGMFLAGKQVWKNRLVYYPKAQPTTDPAHLRVRLHAALIAIIALVLQVFVCGLSRTFHFAQYYNGLWVIYVWFAWLVVDQIVTTRKGLMLLSVYGVALVVMLSTIITLLHQRGGSREFYGPTIANKYQMARAFGTGPRDDFYTGSFYRAISTQALKKLCVHDNADRIEGPFVVEFLSDDPLEARCVARRVAPKAEAKSGEFDAKPNRRSMDDTKGAGK